MKIKTAELTGAALDWAVAKCEGVDISEGLTDDERYSTNWALGGPIIEREINKVSRNLGGSFSAQIRHTMSHPLVAHPVLAGWTNASGPTMLIAAMRCYIASKLGEEVDVPEELCASN